MNEKVLKKGSKAPPFSLEDKDHNKVSLKDFKNKWVVLYFYPKDNTSGCTREALDFTSKLDEFLKMNAVVIGISPDSPENHKKFVEKHSLQVLLLSDPEHKVIEKYGCWRLKKMYGREYFGVVRSTFIINPEQKIEYIEYKVKVKGHVDRIIKELKKLIEERENRN